MTDSGISNIVALSSIHLNLGHSAATHIGAIKIAIQIGVSKKCQVATQINPTNIEPYMNTDFASNPFLLISPKNGSPRDSESISGQPHSGYSDNVRNVRPTAKPPQASALTCLDS